MAIFKCKICGGDLEVIENVKVTECEYCGTKQTVPTAKDENLHSLFNRANTLRIKGEFDKAEKIYEKIIGADETQAEAYWGLILCKYGIEYVKDPATCKRVPTCHRASFDSIVADDDYKTALKYADGVQRVIYESEAAEIDRIQKEILTLSQKEEPYDVFICYKETDETGRRTQDSVITNDIYHQLTQEGLKVFYSAISLEDKLGSAYEPCIFAALNSAKVMLVIGTKPEYFNAVWVKNEWSRYLKLMKTDRSRILIPCYRDMDAYELPEEFSHLQAQDMSKIGFINDVVRGIKKVVVKNELKKEQMTVIETNNSNIAPLLKRVFMFLEENDWRNADEYCEKVLDMEPECAEAYLGKLMSELKVNKREKLKDCAEPFDKNSNCQKALRFGADSLKAELSGYIAHIKTRNENTRLETIYNNGIKLMKTAKTEKNYKNAANIFNSISDYKNSSQLMSDCRKKAENAKKVMDTENYKSRIKGERHKKLIKKSAIIVTAVVFFVIVFAYLLNSVIMYDVKNDSSVSKINDNPVATIVVKDYGTITVELYYDKAPNTVKNFISLANSEFYDELTFHRVIENFMIQGGCPEGTGMGDPGYSIKGEFTYNGFDGNDIAHERGVISMARGGYSMDSAGSQFFIMHKTSPHLDGQYAAFGMVTEGIEIVDEIATVSTDANDKPVAPVVIESIRVETFGVEYGEPLTIK